MAYELTLPVGALVLTEGGATRHLLQHMGGGVFRSHTGEMLVEGLTEAGSQADTDWPVHIEVAKVDAPWRPEARHVSLSRHCPEG